MYTLDANFMAGLTDEEQKQYYGTSKVDFFGLDLSTLPNLSHRFQCFTNRFTKAYPNNLIWQVSMPLCLWTTSQTSMIE